MFDYIIVYIVWNICITIIRGKKTTSYSKESPTHQTLVKRISDDGDLELSDVGVAGLPHSRAVTLKDHGDFRLGTVTERFIAAFPGSVEAIIGK